MHFPRRTVAALAVAAVVLLSACTPVPEIVPTPRAAEHTPGPTPTPTPTASPLPTLAFGGDCSRMADAEALGAVTGGTFAAPMEFTDIGLRTLGGTSCSWSGAATDPRISAHALPHEVVPGDVKQRYAEPVCEGYYFDSAGCRVAITDDETWVLVTVDERFWDSDGERPNDVVEAESLDRLALVVPLFRASLSAAGDPEPAAQTSNWWRATTCEELKVQLPLSSMLGGEAQDGYPAGFGSDVTDEIAEALGTRLDCKWHAFVGDELNAVLITAYPGGGWDFERASAKAGEHRELGPVAVEGATTAIAGIGGLREGSSALMATDGVNLLWQIEAPDAPAAAAAVMAALSAAD